MDDEHGRQGAASMGWIARLGRRSCGREELSIRSTGLQEKDPVA